MQEAWVQSLGQEDPLEEELATSFGILAWKIPWTEEPGGLQSMGWQGVGHDLVTKQQQQMTRPRHLLGLVEDSVGLRLLEEADHR